MKYEIVELKSNGHPDTLTDLCVEACATRLDSYYHSKYGEILHYNVDKALFLAGNAKVEYGGGNILKPPTFILGGQVSELENELADELESTIRSTVAQHLPNLKQFNVEIRCNNVSGNLNNISKTKRCNDTSFGVGFAPLTVAEAHVLEIDSLLYKTMLWNRLGEIQLPLGELWKIMHTPKAIYISAPLYAQQIKCKEQYEDVKKKIEDSLSGYGTIKFNPDFEQGFPYMTLTGSSIECGDDGQVGRGNRYNGLITPCRPMTMEAYCLDENTIVDGKHIKDIEVGDIVNGQHVVFKQIKTVEKTYELTFESGHKVIATPEHRFIGRKKQEFTVHNMFGGSRGSLIYVDDWTDTKQDNVAVFCGIIHAEGGFTIDHPFKEHKNGKVYNCRMSRMRISFDERETEMRSFIYETLNRWGIRFGEYKSDGHGISLEIGRKEDVLKIYQEYQRCVKSSNKFILRSFLKGFMEGDGSCGQCRRSIDFTQNKSWHRKVVVGMLKQLNFHPITQHFIQKSPSTGKDIPSVRIHINSSEVGRWMKEIGFISKVKRRRVMSQLVSKRQITEPKTVVDIALSGDHLFYANGILSHNSGKNNSNHIGKIYQKWATERANEIYGKTNKACSVILVGKIGEPLEECEEYVYYDD